MSTEPHQQPTPVQEFCVVCGTKYVEGAVFCEKCGTVRPSVMNAPPTRSEDWRTWAIQRTRQYPVVRRGHWRRPIKAVMAFMMFSVIGIIVAGLVTLIYGVSIVAPDIVDGTDWAADGYTLFIVVPFFIDLFTISGYPLLAYYLMIVIAIVASCTWVFLSSLRGYAKELTMKAEPRNHSQIFDISGLIFLEMFALFITIMIAIGLGVYDDQEGVTGSTSELLFLLANASVWEELIVRVLLLGLPLAVLDLVVRGRTRKWRSYILGGGFEFKRLEIAVLLITAAIFGYAHYIGGWEAWVIPWDALGGITFGYLFLKHGLASAIVLHFAIDYRAIPTEVFELSEAYELVIFLIWIGLGGIFAAYYLFRLGEFLTGKKYFEESVEYLVPYQVQPVPYAPAPQQWQPVTTQVLPDSQRPMPPPTMPQGQPGFYGGYICPYCGNTEARWVDGKFQCLRCNRLV